MFLLLAIMDLVLIMLFMESREFTKWGEFLIAQVSIGQKFGITQLGCTMNEKFHIWKLDKFIDKVSSEGLRDRAHNVVC